MSEVFMLKRVGEIAPPLWNACFELTWCKYRVFKGCILVLCYNVLSVRYVMSLLMTLCIFIKSNALLMSNAKCTCWLLLSDELVSLVLCRLCQ